MNKSIIVENICKNYKVHVNKDSMISRSLKEDCHFLLRKFLRKKTQSKYETLAALKDVSFSLEKGDILGLLGANGSGKSTLMKIISRVTMPSSGKITIEGKVGSLLEVGTGFHPELSGRENIFLSGAILGMKRKDISKYFDIIVEFAEMEKFLDLPIKRYSSGMLLRLAFSVISFLNYDILLIDEVLAVGDQHFYEKSIDMIKKASKNGKTVIFVSHRSNSILSLCNKALYLKKGEIEKSGSVKAIVDHYLMDIKNPQKYKIVENI